MSKISFNKEKFIEYLKRGTSIALVPLTLALASCSKDEVNYEETTSSTSISENVEQETTTSLVEETATENVSTDETTLTSNVQTTSPFKKLDTVVADEDFPIYCGTDENGFNYLVTKDNQKLSSAYTYHTVDEATETIKIYHQTAPDSDIKTWFDLYSYDGELLLNNLSYTTFNIIPGTNLAVYKFEETDNYGILEMKEDHCERLIHSAFTEVATYQPGNSSEEPIYIFGINEETQEISVYDQTLGRITSGNISVDEACEAAINHYQTINQVETTTHR